MKVLIDKEKIELRIAELNKTVDTEVYSQTWDLIQEEIEYLQSILQQGEYNQSEELRSFFCLNMTNQNPKPCMKCSWCQKNQKGFQQVQIDKMTVNYKITTITERI